MKKSVIYLIVLLLVNSSLSGQTAELRIVALHNTYGCLEIDKVELSSNKDSFDSNRYFSTYGLEATVSGSNSIPFRSNSANPSKQTLHLGELADAEALFNVPINCGTKFLKIRYSNNTPFNHSDFRIFYGNSLVVQKTPLETGDWDQFQEEIIEISTLIPAGLKVTPSAIDFGGHTAGTSSYSNLVIANIGETPLIINNLLITAPFHAQLAVPYSISCGTMLSLPVEYNPLTPGLSNSMLVLHSNDALSPSVSLPLSGRGLPNVPSDNSLIILEDWSDIVTKNDMGFNDFNGNSGDLNSNSDDHTLYGISTLGNGGLAFNWDFRNLEIAYTGRFFSLFGLTDSKATYNGIDIETIVWNDYYLNLDNIEGDNIISPYGAKTARKLWLSVSNLLNENVTIKLEISDISDNRIYKYFVLAPGENIISWDYRLEKTGSINYLQAKILSLIIEKRHLANNISNPDKGGLLIKRISFETDQPYNAPLTDEALMELIQFRALQYFVDYVGKRPGNLGFVQDRSSFPDLYSIGGQGFAFTAWLTGLKNGWVSESWVRERTLSILKRLTNIDDFGNQSTGKIGYKGFFYHFLGPDGFRKINFDYPETEVDESANTVELSYIDTGLLLSGLYAIQSYFASDTEINTLCQKVFDQVEWDFLLDTETRQFYLGWKPAADNLYSIPASGGGFYCNKSDGSKLLADYYSDEYLLCMLSAIASVAHPVDVSVWDSLNYKQNINGTIISYPGSLFTYQFFNLFYPTQEAPIAKTDWFGNSQNAIAQTVSYCTANQDIYKSYKMGFFGLSACEGPSDKYHAYGSPVIAAGSAEEDGTIAIYPIVSSLAYPEVKTEALQNLWQIYNQSVLHNRFGLPDALHPDISEVNELSPDVLRKTGSWIQRPSFAIDAGPIAITLQNIKDGFIWDLIKENPNIRRAIDRLNSYQKLTASTDIISFDIIPGKTQVRKLTLSNSGERDLVVSSIKLNNPGFKIQELTFPLHLKKNKVLELLVSYTSPGFDESGILTITSNSDDNSTMNIQLETDFATGSGNESAGSVLLHPNPAENVLFITDPDHIEDFERIEILTMTGSVIKVVETENTGVMQVDVSGVETGFYLMKIIRSGNSQTFRFIKK